VPVLIVLADLVVDDEVAEGAALEELAGRELDVVVPPIGLVLDCGDPVVEGRVDVRLVLVDWAGGVVEDGAPHTLTVGDGYRGQTKIAPSMPGLQTVSPVTL
jgi:hypothetical protein